MSVQGSVGATRAPGLWTAAVSRGAAVTLAGVAIAAAVAVVVQLLVLRPDVVAARDAAADRAEIVSTAERFTLTVNTFDAQNVERLKANITPLLTTKFQDSFEKTVDELLTQVSSLHLKSQGEVLQSAVAAQDADSATVLVVADARADSDLGARMRHFRWEVDLVRVDGRWLVDNFTPVA